MKTQEIETENLASWRLRMRLAESEEAHASGGATPALPVAVNRTGQPLGWIERTLLDVDTDRVFIEVSDPGLREELVATYEDEGFDVIAASNSRTLLEFMEQLPIPHDFGKDVVIAEDDFPGTNATDLHRQLQTRGWAIPVYSISTQAPFRAAGASQ